MKVSIRPLAIGLAVTIVLSGLARTSAAAAPSPEQALRLAPTQKGVDYDRPKPEDISKCKIAARQIAGRIGWIVESPDGMILRRFLDTNGDNVVDQWSYFKDGVEVYRDIDSKFSGRADQFRWFNTGGTRWGIDTNGTGKIGAWKVISAEEATAEVVAALGNRDPARFGRVLLTPAELRAMGLGKQRAAAVAAKIAKAEADFQALADKQRTILPDSKWVQFSGGKPGIVPAGAEGSGSDLRVYENVVAIVQSGEKHVQLQIGTLVQVGEVWKVIDAPVLAGEGATETAAGGFFFQATPAARTAAASGAPGDESQKLLAELEKLDQSGAGASSRRAELLEQLANTARTPEDRAMWYRQLVAMITGEVQAGKCADGDKRLQALFEKLQKSEADKPLAACAKFGQLMAAYNLSLQAPKADFTKVQTEWLKSLEQYVADYPNTPDTAEAMLQLAMNREFAGQEDDAKKWYDRIVREMSDTPPAKKAAGAITRLDSVGKPLSLSGKSPNGGTVDIARYRGAIVLVQYWASWSSRVKKNDASVSDMAVLKQLASKYGSALAIVGVNLDTNVKALNDYLAENPLSWPQIFEEGGLDSRPANQLGILTVPTMILVDQQGKVVNRNVQAADLESEIKKLLK
ncbi:MAG: thioredoxin-like domain-containing protein [Thermoguttaceae bacterium]|jgi:thiol-disulfide isomerase/thioredoxin